MVKFLAKTINNPVFHNNLKQKIFYPELLDFFIELMDRAGSLATPTILTYAK
jgi:hypothetical protein